MRCTLVLLSAVPAAAFRLAAPYGARALPATTPTQRPARTLPTVRAEAAPTEPTEGGGARTLEVWEKYNFAGNKAFWRDLRRSVYDGEVRRVSVRKRGVRRGWGGGGGGWDVTAPFCAFGVYRSIISTRLTSVGTFGRRRGGRCHHAPPPLTQQDWPQWPPPASDAPPQPHCAPPAAAGGPATATIRAVFPPPPPPPPFTSSRASRPPRPTGQGWRPRAFRRLLRQLPFKPRG